MDCKKLFIYYSTKRHSVENGDELFINEGIIFDKTYTITYFHTFFPKIEMRGNGLRLMVSPQQIDILRVLNLENK